jgi:membrane protease YdiL (CAAX protease family)
MERPAGYRAVELTLVIACGVGNLLFESVFHAKTAFVIVAGAIWLGYVLWRWRDDPTVLRTWGLRRDNLSAAGKAALAVTAPLVICCVAYGFAIGNFPPPWGFWLILLVYPAWGTAQQFLLNAMLARNLAAFLPRWAVVVLSAALFAASHAPDLPVVALTLPAGALWVLMYRRWPNLWALGIAHAVIGTVVFYGVLGRDPLALLLGTIASQG